MSKTSLSRQIWSAILPINCLGCAEESDWICGECRKTLRLHNPELCFCGKAADDGLCDKHRTELGLDGLTTLWPYKEPAVRELIGAIKYRGLTDGVTWLSENYQRPVLARLPRGEWVVTAIPLSKDRQRSRGFNQSELIGRALAEPVYDYRSLLVRTRDTQPQAKLNRLKRHKNVARAFKMRLHSELPDQVILIDDVITTGSTLAACAKVLRKAGVQKIWALTIAHG